MASRAPSDSMGIGFISGYTLGDPQGSGAQQGVQRTISRDSAGRIIGYSHTNNGTAQTALEQSFGYDNLNRLTSQTVNATSYGYRYDPTGNRTSKTIGGNSYGN